MTRIGFICPSSNTAFEPAAWALLDGRASMHVTRVGVTRIGLGADSNGQFDVAAMEAAARLLADARVDVVAWAGTSGSWLGVEREHALVRRLSDATGVPATTSTIAVLEACRAYGVARLGLVSPYTADVSAQISEELGRKGIDVVDQRFSGLSTNFEFAAVGEAEVTPMIAAASRDADAVAVMCTNVDAVAASARAEARLGRPVFDSIGATVWHAAVLAGDDAPMAELGDLGVNGRLRLRMQALVAELRADTGGDRTTLRVDLPAAGCTVDTCAAESHGPSVRSIRRDPSLPQRRLDTVRWIEEHRTVLVQPDFTTPPHPPQALIDVYGVRAQMLAPVLHDGGMVGWLSVHSVAERAWTAADERAITSAARKVEALLTTHPVLETI